MDSPSWQSAGKIASRRNVLLGTLLLAGCASSAVVFDKSNLPRIQRTGVLTPGFPAHPSVITEPPTNGAVFVLVGSIQALNRSSEFAGFLASQGVNPEGEFSRALRADLQGIGIQPAALPADARRTDFVKDYAALKNGSLDAVLDVVVTTYGYYATTNSAPFRPNAVIKVRLVHLQSGIVLMQDTITMINIEPAGPKVTVSSFQDYSDIAANPTAAVQAMMSALDMAASTVCDRIA